MQVSRHRIRAWAQVACVVATLAFAAPAGAQADAGYSPHADRSIPDRVFFGDTHLHTTNSPDAYLFGVQLSPDEAYRFAKGERVTSTHGLPVRLIEPLDFLVVSDHMEYLGLMPRLFGGDERVLATEYGRMLYDKANAGEGGFYEAAMILIADLASNERKMRVPELENAIWRAVAETADRHDQPGRFTAFTGFEWTSMIEGDNLHRIVIYRGGAETTASRTPVSSLDSPDPEDLWKFMAEYEAETGDAILAIPHNGNLSNGQMFDTKRLDGSAFDTAYARERLRWEPLMEVTQIKGDGETHPFLSPNDEFADYETWDDSNLGGTAPKQDSMLAGEYARSALRRGLEIEAEAGVNPYRFGMIGSTDSHTALATSREENFFGKHSGMEPSATRMTDALAKVGDNAVFGWQQVASGLAAVWAEENTRDALFDAMRRKETYATTGTRMRVRLFAGYDFEEADLDRPDWATHGYARGVPMGGGLERASGFAKPAFLVRAWRDPNGANLDRVQIVKGWLDDDGESRERVYDAALSDGRVVGDDGKAPPIGNTVDLASASFENSIGATMLEAFWADPDFDRDQRAFYYVRVLEIPTPRWSTLDARAFGVDVPDGVERTTQERAYTSPVWYDPESR
ncbi:MAG: hypothetical protein CL931_05805 [Deltaproteobacteria bacterium]|nr:hypothetical protein [Deltaproteobacteria bacterium]